MHTPPSIASNEPASTDIYPPDAYTPYAVALPKLVVYEPPRTYMLPASILTVAYEAAASALALTRWYPYTVTANTRSPSASSGV